MVAPNGARRMRKDHRALPLSDDALIATARACFDAGADGLHAHIRDNEGQHLLDVGRYRAIVARLSEEVPDMYVQVTSEAAGRYDAPTQRQVMRDLKPKYVSVALREMVPTPAGWHEARAFYDWAAEQGVGIQHIVYSLPELDRLIRACESDHIPGSHHLVQLVLGTYDGTQISEPSVIEHFVSRMQASPMTYDWMLCAFGREETECLVKAIELGGKMRVGFENSLWNADGSVAKDNAERVREVKSRIRSLTT